MKLLSENELYHHGIRGQKWGQRNGPPYPLSPSKHSASEKKAGWQKSLNVETILLKDRNVNVSPTAARITYDVSKIVKSLLTGRIIPAISATVDIGRGIVAGVKDKRIYNAIKQNQNVDEKTGFKLKQKETSPEEDLKVINPARDAFTDASKNNCMLCTTAYDLRRRGYDVMAGAADGKPISALNKWYKDPKVKPVDVASDTHAAAKSMIDKNYMAGFVPKDKVVEHKNACYELAHDKNYRKELAHNTVNEIAKQGDGARGNLMLTFANGFGGHSVAYEVVGGKTIIRDAQINRTYSPEKSEKYLQRTINCIYCRTDNLEINPEAIKEAIRE